MQPAPQPTPAELTTSSPQSSNDKLDRQSSHTISAQYYSGPIPPPEALQRYDNITPGLAARLVGMAEAEAKHRHEVESQIVESNCAEARAYHTEISRGQLFGLVITLMALVVGAYVAVQGREVAGSILGTGGISAIVLTFILGRNAKSGNGGDAPNSNVVKPKRRAKK